MNATVDELIVISNTMYGIYLSFLLFMSPGTC